MLTALGLDSIGDRTRVEAPGSLRGQQDAQCAGPRWGLIGFWEGLRVGGYSPGNVAWDTVEDAEILQ